MFRYVHIEKYLSTGLSLAMYIVIKIIKGREYRYQQESYREGHRVRTKSIYLGPVNGAVRLSAVPSTLPPTVPLANVARQRYQREEIEEGLFGRPEIATANEDCTRDHTKSEAPGQSDFTAAASGSTSAGQAQPDTSNSDGASDSEAPSGAGAADGADGGDGGEGQ
jgi:hypothetical protein